MNAMLWMLVIVNVLAAGAAGYISLHVTPMASDAFQVLAGVNILNAVGIVYSLVRQTKT